ncbi:unnamed protein product [Rhizoctonia solani]|uniref:BTB domain-containing protein n=1 Tax=Rhizoctonia solani TaxID=456999 RepID=A0A8H2WS21_9AGAM|nr:unnamed protein product [Rhizoctonia solani]
MSTRSRRSGLISPVSGYSVLSEVSIVESISSRHSQRSSTTGSLVSRTPPPVHPDFTYTDAQVELWTSESAFFVHEFQLKKFSVLAERIRKARRETPAGSRIRIRSSQNAGDVRNTLVVLYTCVAAKHRAPPFDSETLISTLKMASKYDYPDLRRYAIDQLEGSHHLSAIRRIELSISFSIPGWELTVFAELCRRPEPISAEEAEILGMRRFVDISRIREEEQSRRTIQLVNREVGSHELLGQDGTVLRERFVDTAEYTVRYPRLPRCDCRAVRSGGVQSDGSGSESQRQRRRQLRIESGQQSSSPKKETKALSVIPCRIHEVAPRIAEESRALYDQRNNLVERLGRVKQTIATTQKGRPGASVENSLMETSWIRRSA